MVEGFLRAGGSGGESGRVAAGRERVWRRRKRIDRGALRTSIIICGVNETANSARWSVAVAQRDASQLTGLRR